MHLISVKTTTYLYLAGVLSIDSLVLSECRDRTYGTVGIVVVKDNVDATVRLGGAKMDDVLRV